MLEAVDGIERGFVFRVEGIFDGQAAEKLARWLAQVPKGSSVLLDFTRVKNCADFGIAAVARGIANRGEHLDVRGLTRHQARLLRYLGVELHHTEYEGEEADCAQ